MHSVYSYDEIKAFVRSNLTRIGTQTINNRRLIGHFASLISQLPPAWQVLTIEKRESNVIADPSDLARLYLNPEKQVNGFFFIGQGQLDKFKVNNPIVFHLHGRGYEGDVTASHEIGHRIDLGMGVAFSKGKSKEYYSMLNKDWQDALYRELERLVGDIKISEESQPDDVLQWNGDRLQEISSYISNDQLYEHYRPLAFHLSLYKEKNERIVESFAEMSNHYAMVYAQSGGKKETIDVILTKRYPELWSYFRDNVLPMIEKEAETLLAARRQNIRIYAEFINPWRKYMVNYATS